MLFYIIPFQDLTISFLFLKGLPHWVLKGLLLSKELLVIILGIYSLLRRTVSVGSVVLYGFLAYVFLLFIINPTPLYISLVGLRTYLLLVLSFLIGYQLQPIEGFGKLFYKHIKIVFYMVSVFAFLEYFILPQSIWKNPFPIMEMKRDVANLSTSNEYGDLGIPVNAFGEVTGRLLGPFDEPLYMAYFAVILLNFFVVSFFTEKRWPIIKIGIGLLMIFLTQTRAIIIGFILSGVAYIFKSRKVRITHLAIASVFALLMVSIFFYYFEWVSVLLFSLFKAGGRNIGHINAYVDGFQKILDYPFGLGVGTASSAVMAATSNNATENSFINIGLEIGFLGIIWFLGFMIFLIFTFRKYLATVGPFDDWDHSSIVSVAYFLSIQFTFAGFVAPHILTARIIIPFMIIMGWGYSTTLRKRTLCKLHS